LSKPGRAVRTIRRGFTSSDRKSRALRHYLLNLVVAAVAIVIVLGPLGLLVEQLTSDPAFRTFDLWPATSLHPTVRHSPGLVDALEVISFFGSPPWFYVLIGASVIYLWRNQQRMLAIFMIVSGLLGGVVDTAVKLWVDRPRPTLPHPVALGPQGSFPSGHVMTATIGYGLLFLVFLPPMPRLRRVFAALGAFLLICLIGSARLALGVHFVSDVVGGFILGAAWLVAAALAFNGWQRESGNASDRLPH
jgi:membrane-associated phospholipid phosphatase